MPPTSAVRPKIKPAHHLHLSHARNWIQRPAYNHQPDTCPATYAAVLPPPQVMMLLAWRQLTTSPRRNSPFTYWQLAGVHGKNWAYNGVESPSS